MVDCNGKEINVKRFYLPIPDSKCPDCGTLCSTLGEVSHPEVGIAEDIFFDCEVCEAEWEEQWVIRMQIEKED